jgi:hypothetical protein
VSLDLSKLAWRFIVALHAAQQQLVHFTNQAQRQRPITFYAKFDRLEIVFDFLDVRRILLDLRLFLEEKLCPYARVGVLTLVSFTFTARGTRSRCKSSPPAR